MTEIVKIDERSLVTAVRDSLRNLFQSVPQGQTVIIKQLVINVNTAYGGGAKVMVGGDDNTQMDYSTRGCACWTP